jgi:hypothetical protein
MRHRPKSFTTQPRVRQGSLLVPLIMTLSVLVVLASAILAFYFFPTPELLLPEQYDQNAGRRSVHIALDDGELVVPYSIVARIKRRTLGSVQQVDLQVPWPYDAGRLPASPEEARDLRDWVILTFEPREKLLDPAERLKKIYKVYFAGPPTPGPDGLMRHAFAPTSPYADLELFVSGDANQPALIRCDLKPSSLGPILCEARVAVSQATMMRYRFAQQHLAEWRQIDAQARALLVEFFHPILRK